MSASADSAVTAALNELYETEESRLDPVLAKIQFSSLKTDEWE